MVAAHFLARSELSSVIEEAGKPKQFGPHGAVQGVSASVWPKGLVLTWLPAIRFLGFVVFLVFSGPFNPLKVKILAGGSENGQPSSPCPCYIAAIGILGLISLIVSKRQVAGPAANGGEGSTRLAIHLVSMASSSPYEPILDPSLTRVQKGSHGRLGCLAGSQKGQINLGHESREKPAGKTTEEMVRRG